MMKKKVLILGYGVSGKAAEGFLQERGVQTCIYDDKEPFSAKIEWEEIEKLVISPGVERSHPLILEALEKKIPTTSEIGLGLEENKERVLAITGSNGKTSTVLFLEYLFQKAGFFAKALGNVGKPFCSYKPRKGELLLLEISSFQLEPLEGAFFDFGLFLNLYPNHLDWHKTMENYAKAKQKLSFCLKPSGIIWTDSKWRHLFPKARYFPKKLPFSCSKEGLSEETIKGAWMVAETWGISQDFFLESLHHFPRPKHRIQYIGKKRGVLFYNDSKGTNEEATLFALRNFSSPLNLIVGGMDKGASFLSWKENFPTLIRKIYAYGFAAQKIKTVLQSRWEVETFSLFEEAVQEASRQAKPGEIVLLSPGCNSFDQFENFEQRGDLFIKIVEKIMKEEASL